MTGPPARDVVIWRSGLLRGSETFVRHHGRALRRWRPTYLGATRIESTLASDTDVIVYPDTPRGRRELVRLKLTGSSPRLHDALAELRPALIHAHFGGDGWLISRSAARLGIPLVITVHGIDVTSQPGQPGLRGVRFRRNLRTAFDRAGLILAVSESIRDRVVALGADPAKVRTHRLGVPIPNRIPAVPKEWDVIFVGRFVEKKGVDDLLAALAMMPEPRPRALLIGDGPLEPAMRARAAALGLDATFLGAQEPAVVGRRMAESRILVAPSRTASNGDTEGLPTTILEAAGLGVPAVSTLHSGIPEAVTHGGTGLLGAEGDRSALAAGIQALLGDDALRERLGSQARKRVTARFELSTQTGQLEDLYDNLVG